MLPEYMATDFDFLYNSNKIVHYNKGLYSYKVLSNSLTKKVSTKHKNNIYKMWCNKYIKSKKVYPELNKYYLFNVKNKNTIKEILNKIFQILQFNINKDKEIIEK